MRERERESEQESERGRYQLCCGTYHLRHKLFPSPFCCSCLHTSLTYLFISASYSPSQAGKQRTENTRLTSDTWIIVCCRPPRTSGRKCSDAPHQSITAENREEWPLNPALTRLPGTSYSFLLLYSGNMRSSGCLI